MGDAGCGKRETGNVNLIGSWFELSKLDVQGSMLHFWLPFFPVPSSFLIRISFEFRGFEFRI